MNRRKQRGKNTFHACFQGAATSAKSFSTAGVYDYGTIHSIVDSTPVLHVAFNPITSDSEEQDSFPAILPMLGCTGSLENPSLDLAEGPRHLYLHGYISSRLMKLPTSTDTDGSSGNPGVPVCVAATMMDGIVLAMTPFNHSCDYRSAVVHGFANAVTDEAEKFYAMELITNNLVSDRWSNTRIPPTKTEMQSTGIMRIEITSASAKIHTGPPNDERKDLKNQDMKRTVWTGVIPTW